MSTQGKVQIAKDTFGATGRGDLQGARAFTADVIAWVIPGERAIKLGALAEGGLLVQARGNTWGQLIFKDLVQFD